MKIIRSYYTKLFLGRWFATSFALLALLSVVDSLGNADILPEGTGLVGGLRYMLLRLPALYDRIFMFALFVSLLLTFLSLIRRNELVSFVAMSVSPLMQIRALAPVVILVAIASAVLIDQTLPRTANALDDWLGVGRMAAEGETSTASLWIAEDTAFVEIGTVRGSELLDVVVYERAGLNAIRSVTRAPRALFQRGYWQLEAPQTLPVEPAGSPAVTRWSTQQTPKTLQKLSTSPRNLSLRDQYRLSALRNSGTRPFAAYLIWALHRLTMPLVAFGFVLVAVPLMQQFGRRETGDDRLMTGIALAFGFFITDGVLKTVAEGGGVSVLMAIGLPMLLLYGLGIYMNLEAERVK